MSEMKETVDRVSSILYDFIKSKNFSLTEITEIRSKFHNLILSSVLSPEADTESYEKVCYQYLDKVTQVKGVPVRVMFSSEKLDNGGGESGLISGSGIQVAQQFGKFLPKLKERLAWCVDNYKSHASEYFNDQVGALFAMVDDFLENPPPTIKKSSPKIAEIKKEIRYLAKWNRLVYTWHDMTFPREVEYIFTLGLDQTGGPIGAIWHYNALDEQGDYRKTYDHKMRDGVVYFVENSWAMQMGFIAADAERLLSSIDLPQRAMGCVCSLQWLSSLSAIPPELLTIAGRNKLAQSENVVDVVMTKKEKIKELSEKEKSNSWIKRFFNL